MGRCRNEGEVPVSDPADWPNARTDWEMLLWCALSPEMSDVRERALDELRRRAGSDEGADAIVRERVAVNAPIGMCSDWVPRAFRESRPRPEGIPVDVEAVTASGSRYRIAADREGRWWLSADNRASATSRRLDPADWWEIAPPEPWPPVLGRSVRLMAPPDLAFDDPRRIPGGGKVTTPIRALRWIRGGVDVGPAGSERDGATGPVEDGSADCPEIGSEPPPEG